LLARAAAGRRPRADGAHPARDPEEAGARRLFAGYFICNARDAIALETVPHVLRLPDVLAFIRLPRINGQALHTIA
jgi:hypothetical protein